MDSMLVSVFLPVGKTATSGSVAPNRARRYPASIAKAARSVRKDHWEGRPAVLLQHLRDVLQRSHRDLFEHHKFPIGELFYMLKEIRYVPTAQIARDLDRDYEAILNFVHEIQDRCNDIADFTLNDVCEVDKIYVTAGKKGIEQESPRERGLSKKDMEPFNETNHRS